MRLFPRLEGVHIAGWVLTFAFGAFLIGQDSTVMTAYGGFCVGFAVLWAFIRHRYQSVEFRTAVDEVSR